jgi:hypothetical protein
MLSEKIVYGATKKKCAEKAGVQNVALCGLLYCFILLYYVIFIVST